MVRITEEMVRKRAEHNESEIFSLEEISLHQQDIEKIEFLDKWCKNLKILYLQSNLISKIENLSRLKQLEYLNLCLNNIERIENLSNCEFLKKLDLTLNFIGELTSVENLCDNHHLRELFLTGNPCADFEGYRDYVISTLPQLTSLDGVEIKKSDRIKALQTYNQICKTIYARQNQYFALRSNEKREYEEKKSKHEIDSESDEDWNKSTPNTPEYRYETYRKQEKAKRKEEEEKRKKSATQGAHWPDGSETRRERTRFFNEDGTPLSFNDPKVDYEYRGDDDDKIVVSVHVFKHMDSSLLSVDVQPTYVRVTLKNKVLQLALSEEVRCEQSVAKRSQITGHLVITMPKLSYQPPPPTTTTTTKSSESVETNKSDKVENVTNASNYLEVNDASGSTLRRADLANIVTDSAQAAQKQSRLAAGQQKTKPACRANSPNFVDDPDVPPLF